MEWSRREVAVSGYGTNAFTSIQDAIDAVEDGGTVHIAPGSYAEYYNPTSPSSSNGVELIKAKMLPS